MNRKARRGQAVQLRGTKSEVTMTYRADIVGDLFVPEGFIVSNPQGVKMSVIKGFHVKKKWWHRFALMWNKDFRIVVKDVPVKFV